MDYQVPYIKVECGKYVFSSPTSPWIISVSLGLGQESGSRNTLTLKDTRMAGGGNVETFIVALLSNNLQFSLTYGWKNGPTEMIDCIATDIEYNISETGTELTIVFFPSGGLDISVFQTSLTHNVEAVRNLFKEKTMTCYDALKILCNLFNEINKENDIIIKFGNELNIYKEHPLIKRSNIILQNTEKFETVPTAGKNFADCVDLILQTYKIPKEPNYTPSEQKANSEQTKTNYMYFTKKFYKIGYEGKKEVYALVVYSPDLYFKEEKKVRKKYVYPSNTNSNVINVNISNFKILPFFSQAINKNIIAVGIETKDYINAIEWSELVSSESKNQLKKNPIKISSELKISNPEIRKKGILTPSIFADFLKNKFPPKILVADVSEVGWDTTRAGKAILNKFYDSIEREGFNNLNITLIGDPQYSINPAIDTFSYSSKEERKIVLGELINIDVYTATGERSFFSGDYIILGISHSLTKDSFITKLSCVKSIETEEKEKAQKEIKQKEEFEEFKKEYEKKLEKEKEYWQTRYSGTNPLPEINIK